MKKKLFLKMWLPLILFVLMSIGTVLVMRYFGQPWSGICAFVTYGGFLLYGLLLNRKRSEPEEKKKPRRKEMQAVEDEVAAEEKFALPQDGELPYLLVLHSLSGWIYQVFRGRKGYYFIHVGNERKGIDERKMRESCPSDTWMREDSGQRFILSYESVERFEIELGCFTPTQMPNCGSITFYTPEKKRYTLLLDLQPQQVDQFFTNLRDRTEKKERAYQRQKGSFHTLMGLGRWRRENQKKKTFRTLQTVTMALTIAGATLSLAFFFLPVPYKLTSAALVVLSIVAVALPLIFPAYYSLLHTAEEAKKAESAPVISWMGPAVACNAGLMLRSMKDFTFLNEWILFAVGGGVALVVTAAFIIRSRELRWRVGAILGMLFMTCVFGMGLPAQLNYLLDTSETVIEEKAVLDMHVSTSYKGGRSYYCTVEIDGAEVDVEVDREAYQTYTVGEIVEVGINEGAFGMAYCQIRKLPS